MTTDDTIRGLEPAGWRYKYSGISKKWTVQKNKPAWHKPQMADVALEPLYSADALRTLTAQLDEARAGEAHWKAEAYGYNWEKTRRLAAESRLEELTRERDEVAQHIGFLRDAMVEDFCRAYWLRWDKESPAQKNKLRIAARRGLAAALMQGGSDAR